MAGNLIGRIKELGGKDISQFLYANVLYSISTGLISLLSPFVLAEEDVYENFIYIFQSILYLTSISTAGFAVALLRYYKYDSEKYSYYYKVAVSLIYILLIVLGLYHNNPLTGALHLQCDSYVDHFLIYISVAVSLMFVFNRAILTAKEEYKTITKDAVVISLLRIVMLGVVAAAKITDITLILFLVCILPMLQEVWVYAVKIVKEKRTDMGEFPSFIVFAIKVSLVGIIFMTSTRLMMITTKSYSDSLAASLSFASGFIGIINILNTTLSTFYIGKLDARNLEAIGGYLSKVKKFFPLFSGVTIVASVAVYLFIWSTYPTNAVVTAWIGALTIVQSGLLFPLGLITLLAKTYNILNWQLAVNLTVCGLVYLAVTALNQKADIVVEYLAVNAIIILGEAVLALKVLNLVRKRRRIDVA